MLRGANFTTEACRLCEENGLHDALLSIYIDDCAEYAVALAYIENMQPNLVRFAFPHSFTPSHVCSLEDTQS